MIVNNRVRRLFAALGPLSIVVGCSGNSDPVVPGTGGTTAAGATPGSGGTTTNGGATGKGGSATGASNSGGNATGSAATTAGGNANGGNANGGASIGGTSNGGAGGTSAGGASTGGNSNGGAGGTSSGGSSNGGTSKGGTPTGGTSTGGNSNGGANTGGAATGGTATGGAATGGAPACVTPGVTKDAEEAIALSGFREVSYGGYLNGESFQQDGIVTYKGYQYTAFWNTNRRVVLARRKLSAVATVADGPWQKIELTDYTNTVVDAHNTISLGVSPADGRLHLSFDHHGNNLHYRRSNADILNDPATATWAASSFGTVTSALVSGTNVTLVTYPRFITQPGGTKLLFGARLGASGAGDEHLWEYNTSGGTWAYIGKYLDGITESVNAYPHGLSYTRGGTRLHISWCWRETPDATTNRDLYYMYSDDHGRTWKNSANTNVATTGTTPVTLTSSTNTRVWTINKNRGLINQEHMTIDSAGRVHVLLSHMPDGQADDSNFTSARTKAQYFHYMRDTNGTWVRHAIGGTRVMLNFRGKLAVSSNNNVYAVLPTPSPTNANQAALRIMAASPCDNYATWTEVTTDSSRAYFSDPLIDTVRLESSNELTIYYPQQNSENIWGLDYTMK